MLSGGKQLGSCLLLAGVIAAALLLLQPGSSVRADIRLDDYETSWPNHVEVQTIGASLVEQLNSGALPLHASVRKDRSTVAVTAAAGTPPRQLDELVGRVVAHDAIPQPPATDPTDQLQQVVLELDRAKANAAEASELIDLSNEVVTLRRQAALNSVSAGSTRSRFVALNPASERTSTLPVLQWVVAAGLVAAGSMILGRRQR